MSMVVDPEIRVIFVTVPDGPVADEMATTLVEESRVACVNVVPSVQSVYRWNGKVCRDSERLLVMKCPATGVAALMDRVRSLHPYDCPEILALPVREGSKGYVQWVLDQGA